MRHPTALATCALLLSACASSPSPEAPPAAAAPPQPVTIANPASVFCIQQGGKLRMVQTAQGESMHCILPDGREVEEWEYFRSQQRR